MFSDGKIPAGPSSPKCTRPSRQEPNTAKTPERVGAMNRPRFINLAVDEGTSTTVSFVVRSRTPKLHFDPRVAPALVQMGYAAPINTAPVVEGEGDQPVVERPAAPAPADDSTDIEEWEMATQEEVEYTVNAASNLNSPD